MDCAALLLWGEEDVSEEAARELTLLDAKVLIGRLGGWTGYSSGAPPGTQTLARGLERVDVAAQTLVAYERLQQLKRGQCSGEGRGEGGGSRGSPRARPSPPRGARYSSVISQWKCVVWPPTLRMTWFAWRPSSSITPLIAAAKALVGVKVT